MFMRRKAGDELMKLAQLMQASASSYDAQGQPAVAWSDLWLQSQNQNPGYRTGRM